MYDDPYVFDPISGQMIPRSAQGMAALPGAMPAGDLTALPPGYLNPDLNAAPPPPPIPQAVDAPYIQPVAQDANVEVEKPGVGDKVKKVGKAAGALNEAQMKLLGLGQSETKYAPAAAAAIPKGVSGSMQQLGMAAPIQRKSLADLLNYRG